MTLPGTFSPLNLLSKNLDWKIGTQKPFLPFHDDGEGWEEVLENERRKKENWTLINSRAYPLFSFTLPRASSCSPKAFRPGEGRRQWWVCWRLPLAPPLLPETTAITPYMSLERTIQNMKLSLFPLGFSLFSALSSLTREIPWTEERGRLQSLGPQRGGDGWDKLAVARGFLNGVPTPECTREMGAPLVPLQICRLKSGKGPSSPLWE